MTNALQQRAEIELLHLIEVERGRRSAPRTPLWRKERVSYHDPEQAEQRELVSFRFCAEALAAIGALPASDIEKWIDRFQSESRARERRPEVAPNRETEHRARALLAERRPPSDPDSGSADYQTAIERFQAAQAAINVAGALTREERAEWQERLLECVRPEDRGRLRHPPPCRGLDLKRVIPGPAIRHGGVRFTHVELYADGLVVHWHGAVEDRERAGRDAPSWRRLRAAALNAGPLELADDAGTTYRWWPGPSHDSAFRENGFVYWLSDMFAPAVPDDATRLAVSREGNTYDIELAR